MPAVLNYDNIQKNSLILEEQEINVTVISLSTSPVFKLQLVFSTLQ